MKRVLVVDDAQIMRFALRTILEKNGYEVAAEAVNGIDAVKKFREMSPDVVTMDITMPEMNGIDAIKEIMKFEKDAKILVISAMGNMENVFEAIKAGARGFIVKPFKENDIIKNLNKIK